MKGRLRGKELLALGCDHHLKVKEEKGGLSGSGEVT